MNNERTGSENSPPSTPRDPLADYRLTTQEMTTPRREAPLPPNSGDLAARLRLAALADQVERESEAAKYSRMRSVSSDVWPPSPYDEQPNTWRDMAELNSAKYVSPMGLARGVLLLIVAQIVLIPAELLQKHGFQFGAAGDLNKIALMTCCATGFVFLMWTFRLYKNLKAFQTSGLATTPWGAIGRNFIPFVNIYLPCVTLHEIWKASDPSIGFDPLSPHRWKSASSTGLITVWWVSYIIFPAWKYMVASAGAGGPIAGLEVASAFQVVTGLLCIAMVRGLTFRQMQKFSALLRG